MPGEPLGCLAFDFLIWRSDGLFYNTQANPTRIDSDAFSVG
jgi:hypothetical protein